METDGRVILGRRDHLPHLSTCPYVNSLTSESYCSRSAGSMVVTTIFMCDFTLYFVRSSAIVTALFSFTHDTVRALYYLLHTFGFVLSTFTYFLWV